MSENLERATVLVMVTVPKEWELLDVAQITGRLRANPKLLPFIAEQIRQWASCPPSQALLDQIALERQEADNE